MGDTVKKLVRCHVELRGLLHPRQPHSLPGVMPSYTVTVATGSQWFAGTDDYIYLSLIGSAGCSEKHLLDKAFYNDFERGAVRTRARDPRTGEGAGTGAGCSGAGLSPNCERIWDSDCSARACACHGKWDLGIEELWVS